MSVDRLEIVEFLKTLYLFRGLADDQLALLASWFTTLILNRGDRLFSIGDPADSFFIIQQGQVEVNWGLSRGRTRRDILIAEDFFGEESLLYNRTRSFSIVAVEPTKLLRMETARFHQMVRQFPQIRANLVGSAESRLITHHHRFPWLKNDEVVYVVRRKHEVVLILSLIAPFVIAMISLAIVVFVSSPDIPGSTWTAGVSFAVFLFGVALLWGIWKWIDWGNDYYIITDQRVVWVERVIWLYDSRSEAPLATILSVNVTTNQVGRILNYGDVIVRTFTGQIVLRNVGMPYQMAAIIEEYWHRAQRLSEEGEKQEMEQAIQRVFKKDEVPEDIPAPSITPPTAPPAERPTVLTEPSFRMKYLANFFKMRFQEGDVITYRKYWTVLIQKTWLPGLGILAVFVIFALSIGGYITDRFQASSPGTALAFGIPVLAFILIPWWLYQYVDWRNDIYQVTDKNIFDIERRPLGTEVRKSAPLESILSLEHERVGFLGYLLNYGNVTINVGETRFVFLGVHDPAGVQQDVFNRLYALRRQKEQAKISQERDRVVQMLETYHRELENRRENEDTGNVDREF
jgi:uncharacterized membrane protein YdbT with pleckstrin-like domain